MVEEVEEVKRALIFHSSLYRTVRRGGHTDTIIQHFISDVAENILIDLNIRTDYQNHMDIVLEQIIRII